MVFFVVLLLAKQVAPYLELVLADLGLVDVQNLEQAALLALILHACRPRHVPGRTPSASPVLFLENVEEVLFLVLVVLLEKAPAREVECTELPGWFRVPGPRVPSQLAEGQLFQILQREPVARGGELQGARASAGEPVLQQGAPEVDLRAPSQVDQLLLLIHDQPVRVVHQRRVVEPLVHPGELPLATVVSRKEPRTGVGV